MSFVSRLLNPARLVLLGAAAACCLLLHAGVGVSPRAAEARALSPVCTGLSGSDSPGSPQGTGTTITITGAATGCPAPSPLYEYWVQPAGGSYSLVQSWTTGAASWNTAGFAATSYTITIWAKDASSTTTGYDVDYALYYTLSPACTGVTLSSLSPSSPEPTGEQITLTGTATGCPDAGPLYEYWLLPPGGSYQLLQSWTTGTATWNTTGLVPGSYWLTIWAKDASSTTTSYDADNGAGFTLSAATAPATVTLTSPSNGATGTGTTPSFSWSAPSGATTYTLTLWDPFTGMSGTKIGDYNAGTSTSYTLGSGILASYKSYEWNVSACNGQACSGYGSWWLFSTSTAATTAQQSSPSNGATDQTLTPTLTWSAPSSGYVPGTTTFTVSIWDAYAPPAGHFLGNLTATTALTTSVPAAEGLFYSQTYYWNLNACNGSACSGYNGQWFSFSTENQPSATLSGAGQTEVLNGDFSGAAIGSTSIPGWSGSATIAAYYGFTYAQGVASLTSSTINLDFAGRDGSGNAAAWFRLAFRTYCTLCTISVTYNSYTVYSFTGDTTYGDSDFTESAFAIPYTDGSSGQLVLTSSGGATHADVAYLQRLDGPVGRANTSPALVTGAYSTGAVDASLNGLAGPLTFSRVYNSQSVNEMPTYSGADVFVGSLGPKWWDNWQERLLIPTSGTSTVGLLVPGGAVELFTLEGGSYVSPVGVHASLTHSGATWTLTTAAQVQELFTTYGSACTGCTAALTSVKDRDGNTTTLAYDDSLQQLESITDAGGRELGFGYNSALQLDWVGEYTGGGWLTLASYTYDATTGDLTSATDVLGHTTSYAYSGHLLTAVTDARSNVVLQPAYDTSSRLSSVKDAASDTTSYSYAAPGAGAVQVTDPRSHTSTTYFNAGLLVTDTVDPYSKVASVSYDSQNNPTGTVDPLGDSTAATYDSNGNKLTVTDAENYTTTSTYDSLNDVLTVTDPLGQETTNTYNTHGNLTASVFKTAGGTTVDSVSFTVNSKGQVTQETDPRSNSTTYGYDSAGDRTTVTDAYSQTTTTAYDYAGRPTSVTDPLSHVSSQTWSDTGTKLTVTDATSHTATYTYDADGNVATATDGNGNTTTYTYNSRNLLVSVQDPVNGSSHLTSYGYDAAGNRTSVTDANGHTTSYTFDNDNRPLAMTDARSVTQVTYTYDDAGRVLTSTDANGHTTSYTWTPRSEPATVTYAGSTGTVSYSYDALGNRVAMADSTGTTTYSYDPRNRITQVTYPGARSVGYAYDAAGNRTSLTYPGATGSVSYAYDNDNRLSSVTDWNSTVTSYSYDNAGRLTSATLPAVSGGNHVISSYSYFNNNQLQSVSHQIGTSGTVLASATYTQDSNANRLSKSIVLNGGSATTETYCYDGLNRLLTVNQATCGTGSSSESFTYDRVGNRTAMTTSAGTTSYSNDNADELTSTTPPGSSAVSYSYDSNGNLSGRGSDGFNWDDANRLTSVSIAGGASATMTYNGDGLRQTQRDPASGITTNYIWDAAGALLDDGTQYVYGAGAGPVAHVTSSGTSYYLTDGLGSTLALIDSTTTVQQTYTYDVYGAVTASSGSQSTTMQFAGQQTDATGLQYLRARYYDPATGRFLSRDPESVSDPSGHPLYSYAGGNPVSNSDPSGLDFQSSLPLDDQSPAVTAEVADEWNFDSAVAIGQLNGQDAYNTFLSQVGLSVTTTTSSSSPGTGVNDSPDKATFTVSVSVTDIFHLVVTVLSATVTFTYDGTNVTSLDVVPHQYAWGQDRAPIHNTGDPFGTWSHLGDATVSEPNTPLPAPSASVLVTSTEFAFLPNAVGLFLFDGLSYAHIDSFVVNVYGDGRYNAEFLPVYWIGTNQIPFGHVRMSCNPGCSP